MIIAAVLMFIGKCCKDKWTVFTRALQIIIIMPMMDVSIPALEIELLQTLFRTAFYDILDYFNPSKLLPI